MTIMIRNITYTINSNFDIFDKLSDKPSSA